MTDISYVIEDDFTLTYKDNIIDSIELCKCLTEFDSNTSDEIIQSIVSDLHECELKYFTNIKISTIKVIHIFDNI